MRYMYTPEMRKLREIFAPYSGKLGEDDPDNSIPDDVKAAWEKFKELDDQIRQAEIASWFD